MNDPIVQDFEPTEPHQPHTPHSWRGRIMWMVGVVVVIGVGLFCLPIPFGRVSVSGDTGITAAELEQTGILGRPINVLQISRSGLTRELQQDLRISSVSMGYSFPAELQITLTKRIPIAEVMTQLGYGEIDATGQIMSTGHTASTDAVPFISGIKLGNVLLGDTLDNKGVLAGLAFLNALSPSGRKLFSEINVGNVENLVAYTVDGIPVHLGNTSQMAEKAKLTESMLRDIREKNVNVEFIDAAVDAPYIKTRK